MSIFSRLFVRNLSANLIRKYFSTNHITYNAFDFGFIKSHQNRFEKILSDLDDVFIPYSQLNSVISELDDPLINGQMKQSFWTKFLQISFLTKKESIVDSLLLFILHDSAVHSPKTLLCVLNILAVKKRFCEFDSLYRLLISRLSPEEIAIFSGDIATCLCLTPSYKEAESYFTLALSKKLPLVKFSCLLNASARNDSFDEMFDLVDNLYSHGLIPADEFYLNLIARLKEKNFEEDLNLVNRLLEMVRSKGWFLSSTVVGEINRIFDKYNWKGHFGAHIKSLRCSVCGAELSKFALSDEDCSSLAQNFHDIAIMGSNEDELYLTTTPSELESLKIYTKDRSRKFDCVIDLPNFLHSSLASTKLSPLFEKEQVEILRNALLYLHKQFQFNHFCLAGKKLRFSSGQSFWDPILKLGNSTGITVRRFFTSTTSDDDTFIIYLALWSGPHCYIISNDEFRQHRCTLGTQLGETFSKWQAARQIRVSTGIPNSFIRPVICDPRIHGNPVSGWHIPYEIKNKRPSFLPPNTWLCLRPPS